MGLPEPKFEEFGDGIKVTVYRAIADAKIGINEANEANEANSKTSESNDDTNIMQMKIIKMIREDPRISQRAIAKELGVARSTIQRNMALLEADGQLQRKGGTRGTWIIQENN